MGKITDYGQVSSILASNIFLLDGSAGTKKILASDLAKGLAGLTDNDTFFAMLDEIGSPNLHRMIYRGKNLGTSLTTEQKAQISAGTFKGLWLGDYWVIGGVNYVIADFDYWYNCGDDGHVFNRHHIVVIPSGNMYSAKMNETNTTEGGYYGSAMRGLEVEGTFTPYAEGCGLYNALTSFQAAFGTALLTHREYLVNAVTDGKPSGGAWFDSIVDLPNEVMIYGSHIFTPANNGATIPTRYTINNSQLALMQAHPKFFKGSRQYMWLRDVVSASFFAAVGGNGLADSSSASLSRGVRPVGAVG